MAYQSFKPGEGASRSDEKLAALKLPDLSGKAVLDLGCNEGFFCFAALEAGARSVTGIDRNPVFHEAAVARARELGLGEDRARFVLGSWDDMPEGPFDVVLLMSALHYARDQAALIAQIATRLAPGGLFVFEGGNTDSDQPWTPVERGPKARRTTVHYPNRATMQAMLSRDFAPRRIGRSVDQSGDPVPRWVWHATRLMTTVMVVTGKGGSGKSTLARLLKARGVPVVATDGFVVGLVGQDSDLGRRVGPLVQRGALSATYREIVAAGLAGDVAQALLDALVAAAGPGRVALLEGALMTHPEMRRALAAAAQAASVVVWTASRERPPEAFATPDAPQAVPPA